MNPIPHIAVVGSVNKGKSSLVSSLCEIDSVTIDYKPGSTTHAEAFDIKSEDGGETILRLFDTPGFQNARKVRQWLETASEGKSEVDAVRAFLDTFRGTTDFVDEWRLLEPIMESDNGILYVVDGSSPFNPACIAEMEILRMTGRPRMAVINQTDERDFIDELKEKLSPYFKTTVYNTHQATTEDRLGLLESFKGIDDTWREPIDSVIQSLRHELTRRKEEVARAIEFLLVRTLSYKETASTHDESKAKEYRQKAESQYAKRIGEFEHRCRKEIRQSYQHHRVDVVDDLKQSLDYDISEEKTWKLFGLKKGQLLKLGVLTGAAAGGAIDLAVGGASLLAGTAIGAVTGGSLAWFGSQRIAQVKIKKVFKLGGESWDVTVSAAKNPQLPFVILDRALSFYQQVASRSHALREAITFEAKSVTAEFPEAVIKSFSQLFADIRKKDPVPEDVKRKLRELIQEQL